jgi:hypothetical protein
VGGHELEWLGTPHLCQHGARDLFPVVVPRHGSCQLPMRGCVLMDPLGAQAIRRPGLLSGCCGEDVMAEFSK